MENPNDSAPAGDESPEGTGDSSQKSHLGTIIAVVFGALLVMLLVFQGTC